MGIFLPFNETELKSLPERLSFSVDRDLKMGRKTHPCSSHRWRPALTSSIFDRVHHLPPGHRSSSSAYNDSFEALTNLRYLRELGTQGNTVCYSESNGLEQRGDMQKVRHANPRGMTSYEVAERFRRQTE